MKNCNFRFYFFIIVSTFFVSCASNNFDFTPIYNDVNDGNYESAIHTLNSKKDSIYGSHDEIISYLDNGVIQHYAKNYKESNEQFSKAELLIDKYKARSISQTVSSFMTNDLAMDYAGEDYEDIYTNIFMSLNYLADSNLEDAMVEVRRFDNKLKVLKINYEREVQIQNDSSSEEGAKIEPISIKFSDSALARYLSMIMYRTDKDLSNAEVDLKYLKRAFKTQNELFDFSIPSTIEEEINIPKNMARLNILGFYGKAPIKTEEVTKVYYPYAGIWYKLSLPVMKKQTSQINKIIVEVQSKKTGEKIYKQLEKIESIENIALDTFQQKYSVIKAKSLARAITRATTNFALDATADKLADDGNMGAALLFSLAGLAVKAHTEVNEIADTRTSRFFPANASVTGITLEPGLYDVSVFFMNNNQLIKNMVETIDVKTNKLNILEVECLK